MYNYYIVANFYYLSLLKNITSSFSISNLTNPFFTYQWMWELLLNLIELFFIDFVLMPLNKEWRKRFALKKKWTTPNFMKQKTGRQLHVIF